MLSARLLRGLPSFAIQPTSIITRRTLASSTNGSGRTRARIFDKMKNEDSEPAPRGKSETYEETMSSSKDANESSNQREKSEEDVERDETARRERIQENIDQKSNKRQGSMLKYTFMFTGVGAVGAFLYLGAPTEGEVTNPTEGTFAGYRRRARAGMTSTAETVTAPQWEKLLPDALPDPYQRPFTLVIELNDSLVHLDWDKNIGWRVATRPGVKDFLGYLGKYYEIVLFSDSPAHSTQPVVDALDPYGFAMYKLYRESTRIVNNKTVKDLSTLNRDMGKIVCVDVNPEMYKLQEENGVQLKKWKGEKGDEDLKKMMTFLEEIALFMTIANSKDIRPILKLMRTINPDDLPAAWETHKKNMRGQFASTKPTSIFSRSSGGGTSVFDIIERAAKEEREHFKKEQAENIATMQEMRKQAELDQKKQIEEMKGKKLKMFDYLFGEQPAAGAPPPQNEAEKK